MPDRRPRDVTVEHAVDRIERQPHLLVEELTPFVKATKRADAYGLDARGRGERRYPLDVLAGAAAGLVIAAVLNLLLLPHHSKAPEPEPEPAPTT